MRRKHIFLLIFLVTTIHLIFIPPLHSSLQSQSQRSNPVPNNKICDNIVTGYYLLLRRRPEPDSGPESWRSQSRRMTRETILTQRTVWIPASQSHAQNIRDSSVFDVNHKMVHYINMTHKTKTLISPWAWQLDKIFL